MTSFVRKPSITTIFAIILFSSCQGPLSYSAKPLFGNNEMNYTSEPTCESLNVAWEITSNFNYIHESKEYWKSPKEFEADGGGDCEDFCIYLMYLLGEEANTSLVKIKLEDGSFHGIVKYGELYIEPQIYRCYYIPSKLNIIEEYDYLFVMNYATNLGSKNIE